MLERALPTLPYLLSPSSSPRRNLQPSSMGPAPANPEQESIAELHAQHSGSEPASLQRDGLTTVSPVKPLTRVKVEVVPSRLACLGRAGLFVEIMDSFFSYQSHCFTCISLRGDLRVLGAGLQVPGQTCPLCVSLWF